ncbi:transporter substrate-binding domain-containing protein [Algihabitans albus]|uniref:transporter substrate-binding domain-containing protein n=1 Tax=Algihabitans albus TaxID=2164067 RepID=UPI0013C37303|nr:transporter substrate-binding domain-containing protein [Algihabitans albus]
MIALAAVVGTTAPGRAAETSEDVRVLRIATEGAYPPFNYVDESGDLGGFDVDFTWALCAVMEVECILVAEPWNSIIDGLVENRYDAIVASMSVTEERKSRVAFTDKYYSTPMRFVAKRDSFVGKTEVKGRAVGAQAETTSFDYLKDGYPFGQGLYAFETMEEAYAALLTGEVEAVLTDSLVAWDFLKSEPGQAFSFVGDPIYTDTEIAIAVRKGDEDLRQSINRAITLLIINGTYQEINQKYFPFSIY